LASDPPPRWLRIGSLFVEGEEVVEDFVFEGLVECFFGGGLGVGVGGDFDVEPGLVAGVFGVGRGERPNRTND
jgi:hypothetical protein